MGIGDWLIVVVMLAVMIAGVLFSRGYVRSVADFLAAGRTAGRYLLSVAGGIAGLGAISIVRDLEMNYIAGFSMAWWGLDMALVVMLVTVSGWVIYRFRQTRCLTLAEFFERRYSRRFRVFAGIIVFVAGTVNFGIFPAVGARFFIHFCGIPEAVSILGITISMFPVVMILLLGIALFFVFTGGHIAVIITDFLQGLFVNVIFLVIVVYLLSVVSFDDLFSTLRTVPEKGASLVNPFKTSHIEDFNFWFHLIGLIGFLYAAMSWQGTQAYNVSAKSAHEAKMGGVLGMWRGFPQGIFLLLVPMLIYTVMHHVSYTADGAVVSEALSGVGEGLPERAQETVQNQMRGPLALAYLLPAGLVGAFAAVMLAAFVSTHDTYLHSWGSVFVQDIVMPLRKKPLTPKQHMLFLRLAIVGVAVVIFFWSMFFQQSEAIALYFAITGAIFAGGSGAVIIGGLYTRWGTTRAAWGALLTGSSLAVGRIVLRIPDREAVAGIGDGFVTDGLLWFYDLNGQECWGLTMGVAVVVYVVFSFVGKRQRFDLDRLLHRGEYEVFDETQAVKAPASKGWRLLGMGREFTKGDQALYLVTYAWTGIWTLVFVVGTIYNLNHDVSDSSWVSYWRTFVLIQIGMSAIVIVWFTIGGAYDLREMFRLLRSRQRDSADDGFVREDDR